MHHAKHLIALGLLSLSFSSFTVQASLNSDGSFVYDDFNDATWTADANLPATLQNANSTIVNAIITANSGVIYDQNGAHAYTLTTLDFQSDGRVTWWGAQAFVGYLNNVNYGGSSQWALPVTPDAEDAYLHPDNSQLGELYYHRLGGLPGNSIATTHNSNYDLFRNIQSAAGFGYWTDTETTADLNNAWTFFMNGGFQNEYVKGNFLHAWAITPGAASVPVPAAIWLFGSAVAGFLALRRTR